MAKLLNRAYERLNRVLDLAGSQVVNDIDIDTAFATHDLNPVVLASRSNRWSFLIELTSVGAATTRNTLRVQEAGDWDILVRNGSTVTDPIDLDQNDFWITDLAVSGEAAPLAAGSAAFYLDDIYGPTANAAILLTSALDNPITTQGGTRGLFSNGEPYYAKEPPILYPSWDLIGMVPTCIVNVGAAGTFWITVRGLEVPRGVLLAI